MESSNDLDWNQHDDNDRKKQLKVFEYSYDILQMTRSSLNISVSDDDFF